MVAERRRGLAGLLLSFVLALPMRGAVVFETEWLSIQIDDTGAVRGLVDRRGGVNYSVSQRPETVDHGPMDRTDIGQIASFLLDCEKTMYRWDGADSMTVYLGQLYETIHRMRGATPNKIDRDIRFGLAIAMRKALRLRREIEGRLGMRN